MQTSKFSIIHAADLHLGSPFKGIAKGREIGRAALSASLKDSLVQATYEALNHLVETCLEIRPHALLLAGDLYNQESDVLKSLNALRSACVRLDEANIPVYMIHGNHDAANLQPDWHWPDNVHVFSADQAQSVPILSHNQCLFLGKPISKDEQALAGEQGDCLAIVHGISHLQEQVTDNLVLMIATHTEQIKEKIPISAWKIGLLHCAVGEKASEGERPYAPCSIEDLAKADLDYWALGHIHKRGKVTSDPLTWYSGNSQGLHINETGPKGCLHILFRPGLEPEVKFYSLANVEWHQLEHSISPEDSLDKLQEDMLKLIKNLHDEQISSKLKGLIVRLRIKGHTRLNGWLRVNIHAFEEALQAGLQGNAPFIWLKDVIIETQAMRDMEKAINNPGLLGETMSRIMAAKAGIESDANGVELFLSGTDTPLGKLYRSTAIRQAEINTPSNDEIVAFLEEAAWLCADLLNEEEPAHFPIREDE